jgi:hypothetical protein
MLATSNKIMPHIAKSVATQIALHLNVDTGQCNPSSERLAHGTGLHERTVRKLIVRIEQAGWIRIERAHGRVNSFQLMMPDPGSQRPGVPRVTAARGGPRAFSHMTPGVFAPTPGVLAPDPGPLRPTRTAEQRERRGTAHARAAPRGGKKAPNGSMAREATSETAEAHVASTRGQQANGVAASEAAEAFARLCAVHPRPEGRDGAEREFHKLLRKGRTTADALIEAAGRYATIRAAKIRERAGTTSPDSEDFTMGLIKWLREGHWANPKTGGITVDQQGNEIVMPKTHPDDEGVDETIDTIMRSMPSLYQTKKGYLR